MSTQEMALAGKTVFITGAATGFGKCLAEGLLERGAKVWLSDITVENGTVTYKEFQTKFGVDKVCFSTLDITNQTQFEDVLKQAVKCFGHLDIMVNNAGVFTEVNFDITCQINYASTIRGTKLAEDHMRTDKGGQGGRIVNVASTVAIFDAYPIPVYCGTKHAIRAFTSSMAQQPDTHGIEYATLCPDAMGPLKIDGEYRDDALPLHKANVRPYAELAEKSMRLFEMEKVNGAICLVTGEGRSFYKMEAVNLGEKWPID